MTKKNNNNASTKNKRKGARKSAKQQSVALVRRSGLDAHAMAWARLLRDPCNAPMVSPCYPSGGTGIFLRFRRVYNPMVSPNNCMQMTFQPGLNAIYLGQTNGAGTVGLVSTPQVAFSDLTNYDSARPVAACLRVMYTGTEANRAGLIGLSAGPSNLVDPSTNVSSNQVMSRLQRVDRIGEVIHEVKWVPQPADMDFSKFDVASYNTAAANQWGSLTAVTAEVGQLIQVELTTVYEVVPSNQNLLVSQIPPKSRNTMGEVIGALGDTAKWVFSDVVAPVLKASAGLAVQAARSAPQMVASATPLMIAY